MDALAEIFTSHRLLVLLSVGTAFTFFWLGRFRVFQKRSWYGVLLIAVLHTVWGVLCVKVFAFLEAGFDTEKFGNMSLFGGVFFMPVFYLILAKILREKRSSIFDIGTNAMLFTLLCARINCLFAGCCQGRWSPVLQAKYPTREAEILFYIVMIVVFWHHQKEGGMVGAIYPLYMISYGIFRFIIEWFRYGEGSSLLHPAHGWALLSLCLGVSIYVEVQKKNRENT